MAPMRMAPKNTSRNSIRLPTSTPMRSPALRAEPGEHGGDAVHPRVERPVGDLPLAPAEQVDDRDLVGHRANRGVEEEAEIARAVRVRLRTVPGTTICGCIGLSELFGFVLPIWRDGIMANRLCSAKPEGGAANGSPKSALFCQDTCSF